MRSRKPFEVGLLEDSPQSTLPAGCNRLPGATLPAGCNRLPGATVCRNHPSSATFLIRRSRTHLQSGQPVQGFFLPSVPHGTLIAVEAVVTRG